MVTVSAPGTHGTVVAGMHGCGVSTPIAADVAAATCGLAMLMHIPNVAMLVIGTKSMTVAAGIFEQVTPVTGSTVSVDGAAPNVQAKVAPETTWTGMASSFFWIVTFENHE
jgi:hypothetical protein